MRKRRRERVDEQRHDFDAREQKRYAWIDWLDPNSAWSQSAYYIPEEYEQFFISFQAVIQEAINNIDIDGKTNADVLDAIIDSELHIAIRQIKRMRIRHEHSLMEIETTKKAHLFQLKEVIRLLEHEIDELHSETKEGKS